MSREPRPNHLRLVGDNELPRTLHEYAGAETSNLKTSDRLQHKLGRASLWLQTDGFIYGIQTVGSNTARLLRGGSFYIPVSYVGTRILDHVDVQLRNGTLTTAQAPDKPVAVFNIIDKPRGRSEFECTDIADCQQFGVAIRQPITLIEENEYDALVNHKPQYGKLYLVPDDDLTIA